MWVFGSPEMTTWIAVVLLEYIVDQGDSLKSLFRWRLFLLSILLITGTNIDLSNRSASGHFLKFHCGPRVLVLTYWIIDLFIELLDHLSLP